jgi:hypothetical protein
LYIASSLIELRVVPSAWPIASPSTSAIAQSTRVQRATFGFIFSVGPIGLDIALSCSGSSSAIVCMSPRSTASAMRVRRGSSAASTRSASFALFAGITTRDPSRILTANPGDGESTRSTLVASLRSHT